MTTTHSQKGDLHDKSLEYYPKIKKAYPNLDHDTMDRVAKYCVVYAKDTTMKSIRQAMNEWQSVFDTDLQ
tara:strand:- start:696 stop:905 length:210 start_codon:yes stop_codon:yes gene_type:complete